MPDNIQYLTTLGLGFLLGARHALEADHLAAVSTLLSGRPNLKTSGWIGFCWGLGHTAILLAVGLVVILLQVTISEPVAQALEFGVGLMLVLLGGSLAMTLFREQWHLHVHRHGEDTHLHLHSHRLHVEHEHEHWLQGSLKPFMVGTVHGLAGSAALTLVVLSAVHTAWEGVAYILFFGIGSIVGMMLLGVLISLPLVASAACGRRALAAVQGLASLGSIGLGLSMLARIGLGGGLP
ncbi:MAG: urease accessory protein [Nitrospira sp.]|nr:urease accessory protein [Nitrospira sp.]